MKPETVEFIFQLNNAVVSSELDFVWALERYISFNKEKDPDIVMKVRSALNSIRFLTLRPTDILRTSLLTAEEKDSVIESLPPNEDFSKMPANLSLNVNKRKFGRVLPYATKKKIISLAGLYTAEVCGFCVGRSNDSNHALWYCPIFNFSRKADVRQIYEKNTHVQLISYSAADLKTIYEIYKSIISFIE